MQKSTQVILGAIAGLDKENLSKVLYDSKGENTCTQLLCAAINRLDRKCLARVEYSDKSLSVTRADLVLLDRETGELIACVEAKSLAAFDVVDKNGATALSHKSLDALRTKLDQHPSELPRVSLVWVWGWCQLPEQYKLIHESLFPKYFPKPASRMTKAWRAIEIGHSQIANLAPKLVERHNLGIAEVCETLEAEDEVTVAGLGSFRAYLIPLVCEF
jgi:hypothetical protein